MFFFQKKGFTLIELLVVIAIIAILSVVVILTLNPAELLRQSRDSTRISDMTTLDSALAIYSEDQLSANGSLGSINTVYSSIADPSATSTAGDQCQGLGLPALPAGISYHCSSSSTFRNTNGTGWIPVNLTSLSSGTPLANLPIDPVNQSSSRLYYTYTTNGTQYEITSGIESNKYKLGGSNDVIASDGSSLSTVYTRGNNLTLEPIEYGDAALVGYWNFDEGTGTIAYDYSGSNATGSWNGTAVGTNGYYSAGKIGSWAGTFDGVSTYTNVNPTIPAWANTLTVSAWIKRSASNSTGGIVNNTNSYSFSIGVSPCTTTANSVKLTKYNVFDICLGNFPADTNYHQMTATWSNQGVSLYIDGQLNATSSNVQSFTAPTGATRIGNDSNDNAYFNGRVDDVRIYSRALSAAEIQAMYAGGK